MLFSDWYTDTVNVIRVTTSKVGNISRETRSKVNQDPIPCRVYRTNLQGAIPQNTSAVDRHTDKLACGIDADIQEGDELIVNRGGLVGGATTERYLAGKPQYFYDPVGLARTGLDHMEVALLADNLSGSAWVAPEPEPEPTPEPTPTPEQPSGDNNGG